MKEFRRTPKTMVRLPRSESVKGVKENPEADVDAEDDVSYERHIKTLKQEHKKVKPNPHIVTELMAVTFKRRHKEILDQPSPVSSILVKFPFLQSYGEV